MTCAQGLLRLLWGGGPKLECYGTDLTHNVRLPMVGPYILPGSYPGEGVAGTAAFRGESVYNKFLCEKLINFL